MNDAELEYVEWKRSGGQVPTLRPTVKVTAQDLSVEERAKLEALIQSADLSRQPERFAGKRAPDAFEHQLTVCRSGQTRTIVFQDRDGHPASVDALVEWLRARKALQE